MSFLLFYVLKSLLFKEYNNYKSLHFLNCKELLRKYQSIFQEDCLFNRCTAKRVQIIKKKTYHEFKRTKKIEKCKNHF